MRTPSSVQVDILNAQLKRDKAYRELLRACRSMQRMDKLIKRLKKQKRRLMKEQREHGMRVIRGVAQANDNPC